MEPPRIFCGFNGLIDDDIYGLSCVGTTRDLERLGLQLQAGMQVVLYDYDAFDSGQPAWILADAVVIEKDTWAL